MIWALWACTSTPSVAPGPYWIERTDAELDRELDAACARATREEQPVLLAFSAPWCGDCRKVRELEQAPPLKEELASWTKVVIDVGRFDRHPALLEAFGVGSVAYWVALQPDCTRPVAQWTRLRAGAFEPASNPDGPRTSHDLAAWLVGARSSP